MKGNRLPRSPWELTDEERWAQAESVLARYPTPVAQQPMRHSRRSTALLIAGIVVVTAVVVLAGLLSHHHVRPHQVSRQQELVGAILELLGWLVLITGFARRVRSAGWRERATLPTTILTWRQRRELSQQLSGRRTVDPSRLDLLRDLASRFANPRGLFLLYSGIALSSVGQTVVRPDAWRFAVSATYVVLFVIVSVTVERRRRPARRFLETHGQAG